MLNSAPQLPRRRPFKFPGRRIIRRHVTLRPVASSCLRNRSPTEDMMMSPTLIAFSTAPKLWQAWLTFDNTVTTTMLEQSPDGAHQGGTRDPDHAECRHQQLEPSSGRFPGQRPGQDTRGRLMMERAGEDAATVFDPLRPRLMRVAYRMLGSVADAEDVVQEAFLRWLDTDRDAVRNPEAFLHRVVTRLCLDQLKSARHRRETYVGPWLPEPVVETVEDEVDDVTLPLMLALERLSPLERAAFLLHDVFGLGFDEVAETIGRTPAACRQLASRARTNVRAARPRFNMPKERGLAIAAAFFAASRSGNM